MRKLARSTAVKSPKRIVSPLASIAGASPSDWRGGMVSSRCAPRRASGKRRTKAPSSVVSPVRASKSAGVPVPSTRPSSIATSQSKRAASSM